MKVPPEDDAADRDIIRTVVRAHVAAGNLLRTRRARQGVERGVLVGAGLVAGAFYFMGGLAEHEVAPLVIGLALTHGAAAYGFHVWKRAEVGA